MSTTFDHTQTFTIITCYRCGVPFGVPSDLQYNLSVHGGDFYCPNGHGQHYTEPLEKKLKRQVEDTQKKLAQAQFELLVEQKSHEGTRKREERLKKRVAKGVCPCCHRQFTNLKRHIDTKHPNYAKS